MDLVKGELEMGRRGEQIRGCFYILRGYSKMTVVDDASHGAFLLDHISLNKKVMECGQGG